MSKANEIVIFTLFSLNALYIAQIAMNRQTVNINISDLFFTHPVIFYILLVIVKYQPPKDSFSVILTESGIIMLPSIGLFSNAEIFIVSTESGIITLVI